MDKFLNQKIKKAVIPVAGYGTRFLPVTKVQAKAMLPVVDKPVIQYIIEEAVDSGIEDIILITSASTSSVEDYFDFAPGLENHLKKFNKTDYLQQIKNINNLANFIYIRQKEFYGTGYTLLCAKHLLNEPFVYVYGDDIFLGRPRRIEQMIKVFNHYNAPVLSALLISSKETARFGVIEGKEINPGIYQVNKLLEKPGHRKTKSRLGAIGGAVLTPEIFKILEKRKKTIKNRQEFTLTDAIAELVKKRQVYAVKIKSKLYDCGTKIDWLKSNIEIGLKHPEVGHDLKKYLNAKFKK